MQQNNLKVHQLKVFFSSNNGSQISQGNSETQSAKGQMDSNIDDASESVEGASAIRNGSSASSISSSNSNPSIDSNSNSKAAENRNQSSSRVSNRQQNTTSISRSGGNTIVDEEVKMNESHGNTEQSSRSFQSNSGSHSSSPNAFYSNNNVSTSDTNSSIQGTKQTINHDSTSHQHVQNETRINHEHKHEMSQSDTTSINGIRQPNTYTIGQNRSQSIEKMKNFNKNN
ncbi:hypothetical protein FK545_10490 [Planococcus glaciei]|nr:hypothetical protein [Planococcus glaciei]QDY45691.1 hypothetical protein FK545_10490 [Planococcus glaciei]